MSADLYDLAVRLRATHDGSPVPRTVYAPALPPFHPVAVTTTRRGRHVTLTCTSDGLHATGTDAEALTALAHVCVDLSEAHQTLVVASCADLANLADLAGRFGRDGDHERVGAVIAWWTQRADHPGTGAVLVVTEALSARYALATSQAAEARPDTWRAALGVHDDGPAGLLDLAARATCGPVLPGLDGYREDDHRSWDYHRTRTLNGRPWGLRDSRREAALGLATRCHAAELYESLRLRDPLVAARGAHTGDVVTGTITAAAPKRHTLTLTAVRPLSRLRTGSEVTGWAGPPLAAARQDVPALTRGTLSQATIDQAGRLTLTITDTLFRPNPLSVGDPLTLVARPADPQQQRNGRRNMAHRYHHPGNWIGSGTAPAPRRRDVPLDVVIAAAD